VNRVMDGQGFLKLISKPDISVSVPTFCCRFLCPAATPIATKPPTSLQACHRPTASDPTAHSIPLPLGLHAKPFLPEAAFIPLHLQMSRSRGAVRGLRERVSAPLDLLSPHRHKQLSAVLTLYRCSVAKHSRDHRAG
jgi:hypothetical protein